jgi:hypothetical protein
MNCKISDKQRFLNLICAIILLVGLGSAAVIYLTVPDGSDGDLGYDIVGGIMYPKVPSKMYDHNLELYGGKMLIVTNDIVHWFYGLWQGKSLAITIAWISAITAFVIFFFNNYVSFEDETDHTC